MKAPEFEAQVMRIIPKDKLPLIAAGVVAAGAIGLVGQRSASHQAEKSLANALDEMTAEAESLRRENAALRRATGPRPKVQSARYDDALSKPATRNRTPL